MLHQMDVTRARAKPSHLHTIFCLLLILSLSLSLFLSSTIKKTMNSSQEFMARKYFKCIRVHLLAHRKWDEKSFGCSGWSWCRSSGINLILKSVSIVIYWISCKVLALERREWEKKKRMRYIVVTVNVDPMAKRWKTTIPATPKRSNWVKCTRCERSDPCHGTQNKNKIIINKKRSNNFYDTITRQG